MDYVCRRCGHHDMAGNSTDYDDDDNDDDDFLRSKEDHLKFYISSNDRSNFVLFFKWHNRPYVPGGQEEVEEDPKPRIKCPPDLLQQVCDGGGESCLAALLEGDTCFSLEDEDLNLPFENGNYPIHQAAANRNRDMVEFLISRGARTDVRTLAHSDFGSNLLPLDVFLQYLTTYDYLNSNGNGWPLEESIYKLVIIICLMHTEHPNMLRLLMLLASRTKEIDGIFNYYSKEGKLTEMAFLLMVTKERIMDPSTIQSTDGFITNQSMIIKQSMKGEIFSRFDEVLIGKGAVSKFSQMCRSKAMFLKSALLLLEVFDKAGDSIHAYILSGPFKMNVEPRHSSESYARKVPKEKVVRDVATILVEAGFVLKDKDIDFTKIVSEIHKPWMPNIREIPKTEIKDIVGGSSSGSGKIKQKPKTKPRAKPRQVESGRKIHLWDPVKPFHYHKPAVDGIRHYSNSSIYVLPKPQFQGKTSVTGPQTVTLHLETS